MTPMTETSPTLADDPAVRAARHAVADLERQLAEARQRSRRLGAGEIAGPETKHERIAREAAHDLEAQLGPARRAQVVAEQAARHRLLAAERPAARARFERLLGLTEALWSAVGEDQAARAALAARLGTLPAPYPIPALLGLGPALDHLRRLLDPPTPAGPPPVPTGKILVRALVKFTDSDGRTHWPDDGAIDVLPAGDLEKALAEGWAEPVEA